MKKPKPKLVSADAQNRMVRNARALKLQIDAMWADYHDLENKILESGFAGNRHCVVVDNFKNKNKVFKTTCVSRYSLDFE